VQLNLETEIIPVAVFPWAVGKDDNGWPIGDGGGPNASFVQENGRTNALPGVANSPETAQLADDDYYFAGSYTTVIPANGDYTPIGTVPVNEEAAERAFAGTDNFLRYHFNLPNTLKPSDLLAVTLDAFNLDTGAANPDPRYGVEVYFNGVKVGPEVIVRTNGLNKPITTPQFTLASVGAQTGPGFDNIVTLKGINYGSAGGGQWISAQSGGCTDSSARFAGFNWQKRQWLANRQWWRAQRQFRAGKQHGEPASRQPEQPGGK
jgi:hypothetical protein